MKQMIFAGICVFLTASLLGIFFAGCSGKGEPIRIGVVAELTGDLSAVGASCRKAAQMAADEINEGGGLLVNNRRRPVEIIVEDNGGKEDLSEKAVLKLIEKDKVLAIVGPNASRFVIAAAKVAEKNEVLLISPWSTSPKATMNETTGKPARYIFRACWIDSFQGRVIAKFILGTLNKRKAAVLYDGDSEYNRGIANFFREAFEKDGGSVVAFEAYKTGQTDFDQHLRRIKAAGPDIVFLPNYYSEIPLQIRQAKKLGIKVPFIGSDSWGSRELLEKCPHECESYYFTSHFAADAPAPATKKFINNYQSRFNQMPDDVAALTYDAFGMLWQAIKLSGRPDREIVRNEMSKIPKYSGITGAMQFQEGSGDPVKSAVILQIKDGQFSWFMDANP